MSRQREDGSDIEAPMDNILNRTIGEVFQEWFVDFAIGKDPQASHYRDTFGRYYKIHIEKYFKKNLEPEFLKKKFKDLTFADFNTLVQTLLNAIKQTLNSAKKSNQMMLIANSAAAAVTVIGGALAYYGVDNGGCGKDNEGNVVEAFAESPKPAIVVSTLAAIANAFLAFRQDANNHFTEIVENALVKILQKVIETGDGQKTILKKLQDKLTPAQKMELDKKLQEIEKNLQEQHHNQHFHESFRFKMRILTVVALALRGTVNISKISALIESSFSQESFCNAQGFTSAEFDAASLQIPVVVTALQSLARNISNDKRKKTFEDQMGDDGILGLLSVIKESVGDDNKFFQDTLKKVFEGGGPDIDSHAGHSHGHGHGHGRFHNCWPFSHHRNAVAPAEMAASAVHHHPQDHHQDHQGRTFDSCVNAFVSCLKATPSAFKAACKMLYARGLYIAHAPLSAIMPESFLQGEVVENKILALPELFPAIFFLLLQEQRSRMSMAPDVRNLSEPESQKSSGKKVTWSNDLVSIAPSASDVATSDHASLGGSGIEASGQGGGHQQI